MKPSEAQALYFNRAAELLGLDERSQTIAPHAVPRDQGRVPAGSRRRLARDLRRLPRAARQQPRADEGRHPLPPAGGYR